MAIKPTNPINPPLPADLPTNWQTGQIVAPDAASVGLAEEYGYNHLMEQVNSAQSGVNALGNSLAELTIPNTLADFGVTATAAEINYTDGVTSNIQTQIDNIKSNYIPLSQKGVASGVATLGTDGQVTPSQLPDIPDSLTDFGVTATAAELNYSSGLTGNIQTQINQTKADIPTSLTEFGVTATATELNYCDGVTSNIQTQINQTKADIPTSLSEFGVTATATELNYCDGVTSNIQAQLDEVQNEIDANAENMAPKVGDIKITARTDLGDNWVLCNGDRLPPSGTAIDGTLRNITLTQTETFPSIYSLSGTSNNSTTAFVKSLGNYIVGMSGTSGNPSSGHGYYVIIYESPTSTNLATKRAYVTTSLFLNDVIEFSDGLLFVGNLNTNSSADNMYLYTLNSSNEFSSAGSAKVKGPDNTVLKIRAAMNYENKFIVVGEDDSGFPVVAHNSQIADTTGTYINNTIECSCKCIYEENGTFYVIASPTNDTDIYIFYTTDIDGPWEMVQVGSGFNNSSSSYPDKVFLQKINNTYYLFPVYTGYSSRPYYYFKSESLLSGWERIKKTNISVTIGTNKYTSTYCMSIYYDEYLQTFLSGWKTDSNNTCLCVGLESLDSDTGIWGIYGNVICFTNAAYNPELEVLGAATNDGSEDQDMRLLATTNLPTITFDGAYAYIKVKEADNT